MDHWVVETPGVMIFHWTAVSVAAGVDPTSTREGSWADWARVVSGPFRDLAAARADAAARYDVQDVMEVFEDSMGRDGLRA